MPDPRSAQNAARLSEDIGDVLSAIRKLIAEDDPAGLLITHPTLIKRPVIEAGGDVIVGWSSDTLAGLAAPE